MPKKSYGLIYDVAWVLDLDQGLLSSTRKIKVKYDTQNAVARDLAGRLLTR